jgi:hypothetical protein
MNSDNLEINGNIFRDANRKFLQFPITEMELLQFMALQFENVVVPVLQRFRVQFYDQITTQTFDEVVKNTEIWCESKRGQDHEI